MRRHATVLPSSGSRVAAFTQSTNSVSAGSAIARHCAIARSKCEMESRNASLSAHPISSDRRSARTSRSNQVVNTRYLPGAEDGAANLANFDHRPLSMGSINSNVTTTLQHWTGTFQPPLGPDGQQWPWNLEQAALQP